MTSWADRAMQHREPDWGSLTTREWQIVKGIAEGATHKQLAAELGISDRTVGTHLRNAYGKLGIHNRVTLARAVFERGDLLGPRAEG